jgi:hypothetical protein
MTSYNSCVQRDLLTKLSPEDVDGRRAFTAIGSCIPVACSVHQLLIAGQFLLPPPVRVRPRDWILP